MLHAGKTVKYPMLILLVFHKFTQHNQLKQNLLATGNAKLVEHTWNDSYWGDGGDGFGKNMLGKTLMQVREKLRHHADLIQQSAQSAIWNPPSSSFVHEQQQAIREHAKGDQVTNGSRHPADMMQRSAQPAIWNQSPTSGFSQQGDTHTQEMGGSRDQASNDFRNHAHSMQTSADPAIANQTESPTPSAPQEMIPPDQMMVDQVSNDIIQHPT